MEITEELLEDYKGHGEGGRPPLPFSRYPPPPPARKPLLTRAPPVLPTLTSAFDFPPSRAEIFLKERAKHPPHCYRAYDALRLCLIQRVDTLTCGKIVEAYRPCAKEIQRERIRRMVDSEEERKKMLAAKAKVLDGQAAGGGGAAGGAR